MRLHTTTISVVDGCSLLCLVLTLRDKEGNGPLTTTTTTLICPTTIQGVVGSDCDNGCSLRSLALFVCSYYVTPGENFKGNGKEDL